MQLQEITSIILDLSHTVHPVLEIVALKSCEFFVSSL